ncbi:hypothetical protein C2E31_08740 [Rhodopirellula baltica]|nr:hypothetical protein C2E31_10585 [Rhodopirellula baltica]PNY37237.1 hypothetical protein C2E31_08740 [Rhodopirellula baltica]
MYSQAKPLTSNDFRIDPAEACTVACTNQRLLMVCKAWERLPEPIKCVIEILCSQYKTLEDPTN